MSFIDNITRKATQAVERAKYEADKLQRNLRLESELNDFKRQRDGKRLEFGDRALELFRAGKIQSPTLGGLLREIEALNAQVTLKEEELRLAQGDNFPEPTPDPMTQHVPVSSAPSSYTPPSSTSYTPPPGTQYTPPSSAPASSLPTKACSNCQFQMPTTAQFCPNCSTRIAY